VIWISALVDMLRMMLLRLLGGPETLR